MEHTFRLKQLPAILALGGVLFAAIAWKTQSAPSYKAITDTIPERNKKVRDIDDALEELDKSKAEVDRSLNNMDWQKLDKQIQGSMEQLRQNEANIKTSIDKAMKEVDAEKIQAEVQKSLAKIDEAKIKEQIKDAMKQAQVADIQEELAKAMKEIDMEKIKTDIDQSLAKVDWEKAKAEMEKAKNIDFEKIEAELKKVKPEIEKSIKEAHQNLDKAKEELLDYKKFIDGLDGDGLIDKNGNYTLEYRNNELTINGKDQPSATLNKYSDFLKKHPEGFTITKNEKGFNIQNNKDGKEQ